MKDYFINRKKEIEIFQSVLAFETDTKILFISGEAGMGKTALVRHLVEICAKEKKLLSTYDYKGYRDSPLTQLTKHITDLGTNNFDSLKNRFADIGIQSSEFKKKELFSSTDIEYALTGFDLVNRFSTLSEITNSFIDGLQKLLQQHQPIVFFLDSLDLTGPITKQWLTNDFFRIAIENRGVIVVASGRENIELTPENQSFLTHIKLGGIATSEWEDYAKQLTLDMHSEYIRALQDVSDGNTAFMKQYLTTAAGAKK